MVIRSNMVICFLVYLRKLCCGYCITVSMQSHTILTRFTVCIQADRPEQTVSHEGLHCLPLIRQFLDITLVSKLYLFKF